MESATCVTTSTSPMRKPPPCLGRTAGNRRRILTQRWRQVAPGSPQDWREAAQDPRDERKARRKRQYPPVRRDNVWKWLIKPAGNEPRDRIDSPHGKQNTQRAAGTRQQNTFSQELAGDASATGAEGLAQGQLLLPLGERARIRPATLAHAINRTRPTAVMMISSIGAILLLSPSSACRAGSSRITGASCSGEYWFRCRCSTSR